MRQTLLVIDDIGQNIFNIAVGLIAVALIYVFFIAIIGLSIATIAFVVILSPIIFIFSITERHRQTRYRS